MYFPILVILSSSLSTRFNDECVSLISNLSNLFIREKFEKAVRELAKIAKIDIEKCVAEVKALFSNETCQKCDSLQSLMHIMIEKKYNFLYKTFYHLVTFLLILPVTSASCERAHSKVDLIKSAVRSSMSTDGLESLVMISSEKSIVDSLDIKTIIDRFAVTDMALPL